MLQINTCKTKFHKRKCLSLFIFIFRHKNTQQDETYDDLLYNHRSAFDHCFIFATGYVGCMKELNINGANIDLVSYAHQQDSGKNFEKEVGRE